MAEFVGVFHNFVQFKTLAPDAIKKCQSISNEEKIGQIINLEKYNSRDFSNVINIVNTLKTINSMQIEDHKNVNDNLQIFFEKNKRIKEIHDKSIAKYSLKLNKNVY